MFNADMVTTSLEGYVILHSCVFITNNMVTVTVDSTDFTFTCHFQH